MSDENPAPVESNPLLGKLLAMARRAQREGSSRQAMELYWSIIDKYPDTSEAGVSKNELFAIAEGFERAGNVRMARGMYERLMELEA